MKKVALIVVFTLFGAFVTQAQARDVKYMLPISSVLDVQKMNLNSGVKLYFGPQASPPVAQNYGPASTTNRASLNAHNNADVPTCQAAFLTALQDLQRNATALRADAVINIESSFKRNTPVKSATEFECHTGRHSAIITLKGEVVKFAEK